MDIQKERDGFENLLLGNGVTQFHKYDDGSYQSASLDYCWHIWIKSAQTKQEEINLLNLEVERLKAQAVPDSFVLVPRNATDEMISHGVNALDRKRTARSCWNAMVEAAELEE